tara:strand:- start:327 stop:1067 length:741 start_codon:yes stop_codon:yes gene_type:complete
MAKEFNKVISRLEQLVANDISEMSDWSSNYLSLHKNRYKFDLGVLRENYIEGRILEIGSAPYQLTYLIQELGFPIEGIDIAPERHESFLSSCNLDIKKCDIENEALPFEDNSFHYILFNEVFEHLRINPIQTLREINRVLHPEGVMIMSTPNLYSLYNIVKMFTGKGFDNPYQEFLKLETIGHMGHVREYSVKQLEDFINNTGFKSIKVEMVTHRPIKGFLKPLNILFKIFPGVNKYQLHVCKKVS